MSTQKTDFSDRLNAKISRSSSLPNKLPKPLLSRLIEKVLFFSRKISLHRWGITKKFAYSYSLAIGIAICGTTSGLFLGDSYQQKAQNQLESIDEQQHLLIGLDQAVLDLRLHPQTLVTTLGDAIWFEYEKEKFYRQIQQINFLLEQIKLEAQAQDIPGNMAGNDPDLFYLIAEYETTVIAYRQLIESLWKEVAPSRLTEQQIYQAQQYVLSVLSGKNANEISVKFERLSEQLTQLNASAKTKKETANHQVIQANYLRIKIIVASMIISAAIAAALAFYTSRSIVRPLQKVTQVAEQVTSSRKFDQQAFITSEDEVGILANSLNQLIRWAGEYTQELETAFSELRQTQTQLIQTEKMSSLGQMVAGVAHEINNPVSFIYGNIEHAKDYTQDLIELIELYQQYYPDPEPEIEDHIEAIELDFLLEDLPKVITSMKMGGDRIKQIVLSLRNFSRLDEAEMKPANLHEGIENTLLILNSRINKASIQLNKDYGDLPLIECYPAQLNQVFMNLLANAIDALEMSDKEPETVKQITISTAQLDSGHICVKIADNGVGMPREIQSKVFDHFFTTKEPGKGTGLGLAISYQIIEKHRGKIEVSSELNQGTEFIITLPSSHV
jgi:two-component system NtrC family sensor kinase